MLRQAVHDGSVQTGSDDFYLGKRKNARNSLAPSAGQITSEIQPALKRALDDTLERDFDIISSSLIALAKIGKDHKDFRLVDVFRERLDASNQEIRETAAIALGIAGPTSRASAQLDLLVSLLRDDEAGRKASGDRAVNERTRAFAAFGLGLAAHATADVKVKARALAEFERFLGPDRRSSRNLVVAAIQGISLLRLDPKQPAEDAVREQALATLTKYYGRDLGVGRQLLQAHCPTAIAKLIDRDDRRAGEFRTLFARGLAGKHAGRKRAAPDVRRSCALALGRLVRPSDTELLRLLQQQAIDDKDAQTRSFCVLALGQIGGPDTRKILLQRLGKARTLDKSWVALALGVHAFHAYAAADDGNKEVDRVLGGMLRDEFATAKNPDLKGALAIALGLTKYTDAAPVLEDVLLGSVAKEELAGYLCIGLALMNADEAQDSIREVVQSSTRRPTLLQQAAVALGRLGDKDAADELVRLLQDSSSNLAQLAAISTGLAFIGDRRSVQPLVAMLDDPELAQLPRAFAAVALGGIADKEPLPWNSKIAVDTNYRATTETLTNQVSGILDIL
ncbi:MAG: HEAT repeat domain-containing protein [bacterium]|nr:HEAT repeat domain-containing protein [bacterium]